MNFCMINNCEYQSKSLNVYKVNGQITSLEQILIICMIGTCMWRINEQLITSYITGSWSRKVSLLCMHNCLLQNLVKNLKGYKSNSSTFLSDCPRGKQTSSICPQSTEHRRTVFELHNEKHMSPNFNFLSRNL